MTLVIRPQTTKEKEKIIGDGKYLASEGEENRQGKGGKCLEKENVWRRKMFGLWRRRKVEKEKNESVLGRDILMHRGEEQKKQKVGK